MDDADKRNQKTLIRSLIFLSLATFGGPAGFGLILRGGASPDWPPDRAVEWVYLFANGALVVAIMAVILVKGIRGTRRAKSLSADSKDRA